MFRSNTIRLLEKQVYYEHYRPEGEDRPPFTFVLIHGFLACTFSFRRIIPLLSGSFEVYALDLVGFGQSEKSRSFRYSYSNYGTLIIEFIRALELKNVILVGHSMGGQVALYAAKQAPERVEGLILIGSSGYLQRANRLTVFLSYLPFARLYMKWWIARHDVRDVLKTTFFDAAHIQQEMIDAYSRPIREKGFCDTLIGLLRHREGDLDREDLRQIVHPVLLIWGEEDRIVPLRKGIRLRQDLPHAKLICLPEAGHQVIEEKPQEVYNEIRKWLGELRQDHEI